MVHTSHTAYVAMQSLSNNFEQHRFTIPSIFNNIHHTILNSVIPHSELHFHTTSLKVYTSHYLECVVKKRKLIKHSENPECNNRKQKQDAVIQTNMHICNKTGDACVLSLSLSSSRTLRHNHASDTRASITIVKVYAHYKNAFVCTRRHVLTHT